MLKKIDHIGIAVSDLEAACQPREMEVIGEFTARGGIRSVIKANYVQGDNG